MRQKPAWMINLVGGLFNPGLFNPDYSTRIIEPELEYLSEMGLNFYNGVE